MYVVEFENEKGNIKMEKSIIQRLIDAGIITKNDIDEYNKQNATGLIKQQAEELKEEKPKQRFSKIKDGVLIKFDKRDLVDGKYVVPSDVTEIEQKAFYACNELKQIIIHEGIWQIKYATFALCDNLKSVILPDSVEAIYMDAFVGCGIEYIDLPKNLKIICNNAFYGTKLKEIEFPDSIVQIGDCAFRENKHLINISLPNNLEIIRKDAFSGCDSLKELVIPEGVKDIREGAFSLCINLERVFLPQSLEAIDRSAFWGCSSLVNINANSLKKEIYLPSNMRFLSSSAFNNTPIEKMVRKFATENKIVQYPGQVFDDTQTK